MTVFDLLKYNVLYFCVTSWIWYALFFLVNNVHNLFQSSLKVLVTPPRAESSQFYI